jgi:DNA primase
VSDAYAQVRAIPLGAVMAALGIQTEWKKRKGGQESYGKCPLHEAKSNQSSFSFTAEMFHCFSCKAKGKGAIDFVMKFKACNFTEAVAFLGNTKPVEPARDDQASATEPQDLKPYRGSYDKFFKDNEWLKARCDAEVVKRYGVGWYSNPSRKSAFNNRVMLPIKGLDGVLYGYLGRAIDEEQPKYLFPKGFAKHKFLWGGWEVSQLPQPVKVLYLLESPFAVMKFASLGLPAVSPFGWSISDTQIDMLAGLTKGLVFLPDGNKRTEASAIVPRMAHHLWIRFPQLPVGIDDPEHLTKEQILAL